jgi:nucleotide-binding universal stress UspA family protein
MKAPIVLVPHDATKESGLALVPARRAAAALNATIAILHVSSAPLSVSSLKQKLGLSDEEIRGCILESAVGADPAAEIIERARKLSARLIVMCEHGNQETIGSITSNVVCNAPCPVLVVRPDNVSGRFGDERWLRRILVPLDATPLSAEACRMAARLAKRQDARLDILHVATAGEPPPEEPGSLPLGHYIDRHEYDLKIWSEEFLDRFFRLREDTPDDLQPNLHLARGSAADEIIEFASRESSDLIVIAWQGCFDDGRAKVIRELLVRAPCPLLSLIAKKTGAQAAANTKATA